MISGRGETKIDQAEVWAPHEEFQPIANRDSGAYALKGRGTRSCVGGWQFRISGLDGMKACRIRAQVEYSGIDQPGDSLVAIVIWGNARSDEYRLGRLPWNFLVPTKKGDGVIEFTYAGRAPEGVESITVRYAFRWSSSGYSRWSAPVVEAAVPIERESARICLVAETTESRRFRDPQSRHGSKIAEQVHLWSRLVEAACSKHPDLIVTPELIIGGEDELTEGVDVPGPATAPFQELARKHRASIVVGLRERSDGLFHNSAVLIDPKGEIQGIYRKAHLASSEGFSGIVPGDTFQVHQTPIGGVGINICMDTTLVESARLCALNGAEFVCMPIMGDLRADRFTQGQPIFNEDRWKAIMRMHALNNQVCMLVARNEALGSCIVDRKGDFLAWNEGDQEFTIADVPRKPEFRTWNGGCFREVTWELRRPHLYHRLVEDAWPDGLGNY